MATGFQLDELVAFAGAGADPGASNPVERLHWAVEVAVPAEWRAALPIQWEVGDTGRGHLALSYSGRIVVSPRALAAPPEVLLATVAHEMGHQITFYFVHPGDGSPPPGFAEARGGGYRDVREAWADCVSRVWTGSLRRTTAEPEACPSTAADWVAAEIASPEILRARLRQEGRAPSRIEPIPSWPPTTPPRAVPVPPPPEVTPAPPADERIAAEPSPTPGTTATSPRNRANGDDALELLAQAGLIVLAGGITALLAAALVRRGFPAKGYREVAASSVDEAPKRRTLWSRVRSWQARFKEAGGPRSRR
ncbi:MAG: hypothetical protein M3164_06680 [Actinomycetota bacterium]|nr:hypothetical protein [Actinomycetota bacterium]